ncbi:MAG: cyclic pyranopterin monophosphate synthase MoaC [Deinococcus-Thermus bacterium]|jgi:cyclic pyranopterin phosphate synthase|nr:cyclic pyranopterin monophosphate synthase MoaC [Deinococcota bacterium]
MASNHFRDGHPVMVDVGDKQPTTRVAVAEARVRLPADAAAALDGGAEKGDPLRVAELAGIMGSKRTSDLIPLCHPLPLDATHVTAARDGDAVVFTASCRTHARTGVEMEALTAASVAALTLYDMLKGKSKGIVIEQVRLRSKEGGVSGRWSA